MIVSLCDHDQWIISDQTLLERFHSLLLTRKFFLVLLVFYTIQMMKTEFKLYHVKKRDSLVDGWPMSVAALSRMAVNTAVNSDSSPFPSA